MGLCNSKMIQWWSIGLNFTLRLWGMELKIVQSSEFIFV